MKTKNHKGDKLVHCKNKSNIYKKKTVKFRLLFLLYANITLQVLHTVVFTSIWYLLFKENLPYDQEHFDFFDMFIIM